MKTRKKQTRPQGVSLVGRPISLRREKRFLQNTKPVTGRCCMCEMYKASKPIHSLGWNHDGFRNRGLCEKHAPIFLALTKRLGTELKKGIVEGVMSYARV